MIVGLIIIMSDHIVVLNHKLDQEFFFLLRPWLDGKEWIFEIYASTNHKPHANTKRTHKHMQSQLTSSNHKETELGKVGTYFQIHLRESYQLKNEKGNGGPAITRILSVSRFTFCPAANHVWHQHDNLCLFLMTLEKWDTHNLHPFVPPRHGIRDAKQ